MSKQDIISRLRLGSPQLSVETLTGSIMNQGQEIQILEKSGVKLLHLDVMDGVIWPKISVGASFLAGLETDLIKDAHLLTDKPENQIPEFIAAGADIITFQIEHTKDIAATLKLINDSDALASVGIYPTTPIETLQPFLDWIDVVFVLSIGPKTGEETFFPIVAERVEKLRDWKPELVIAIDGGVRKDNVAKIAKINPDLIVAGCAIFDGNDAAANIFDMQSSIASVCSYQA